MMSMLRNLPISRKFATAFGTICLLCLLQGVGTLAGLYRINDLTRDLTERSLPAAQSMAEIQGQIQTVRRVELASLLCTDSACASKYPPMRIAALEKYRAAKSKFESVVIDRNQRNQFQAMTEEFGVYLNQSDAIMQEFASNGTKDDAALARKEQLLLSNFNHVLDSAAAMSALYSQQNSRDGELVNASNVQIRWLAIGLLIVVLGLCTCVGLVFTRLIAPPVVAVTKALEQVAKNNLDIQVEAVGKDEIGRLSAALNSTVRSMRGTLHLISRDAVTLSAASQELSIQASQTSANTHLESTKISQIAAAASEMTATIGEISHNAESASLVSHESAEAAKLGGAVMRSASETMERISEATDTVSKKIESLTQRSVEIGKVISVIREISEQTNLLALNAAIESARAGEHGRGFAVVAGEVRRLAERTKVATEEIADTIRNIQLETQETLEVMSSSSDVVATGMVETSNARKTLEEIIESAKRVEGMIQLIATAATEQTSASNEISESASEISKLAGENSRAGEEAAEASKSLAALVADLDGIIRQFQFGKEDPDHGGSSPASDRIDFDKAIDVHVSWRSKLAAYITKPDHSLDPSKVEVDNRCDLGKWLHGDGQLMSRLPGFAQLVSDHARFHKAAAAVIRKADSGQLKSNETALGSNSEYGAASNAIVTSLMKIRRLAA